MSSREQDNHLHMDDLNEQNIELSAQEFLVRLFNRFDSDSDGRLSCF